MSSTGSQTRARVLALRPRRDDQIDAGFLLALLALGLLGLRSSFDGWLFLIVGLVGGLLGLAIGYLSVVLRQPIVTVVAMAVSAYFLLGGALAAHTSAIGGVIPSGSTFHLLATQSVNGWKDLLTTLPPADGSGSLLVLPYLIGLVIGAGGFTLARRVSFPTAPLIAPALLMATVILMGAGAPSDRLLQGASFAVLALVWMAARAIRLRPTMQNSAGRRGRLGMSVVLLTTAGLVATLLGPYLPGVAGKRLMLRNYVAPPFNVGVYPSPLAAFRAYTKHPDYFKLHNNVLFTISGLPTGTNYVRIATMDTYDGLVWKARSTATPVSGQPLDAYQRVGSRIPAVELGKHVTLQVAVDMYSNVWLPTVGDTDGVSFHGINAADDSNTFRYDLATESGVVPSGLRGGDTYTLHAILPSSRTLQPGDSVATTPNVPSELSAFTASASKQWSADASERDPASEILAVATWLRHNGGYTDGDGSGDVFLAGQSIARLTSLVNLPMPAGDDEQFAAVLALIANQMGMQARVVLGAQPEAGGKVYGRDVHAWVEVLTTQDGWLPVYSSAFLPTNTHVTPPQPPVQSAPKQTIVPPPAGGKPPGAPLDASDAGNKTKSIKGPKHGAGAGFLLPGFVTTALTFGGPPIGLLLVMVAVVVGLKLRRRRRRRTIGSVTHRLAAGWRDLLDYARDLGDVIPGGLTRREQGRLLNSRGVMELATMADAHVFGPGNPHDDVAAAYWAEIDSARSRLGKSVGRWRRIRAALSLKSFRSIRPGEVR